MKLFKYSKNDLIGFIKYNPFLEEILNINPRKLVFLSIKKNIRWITGRYEILVIVNKVLAWKKEGNNYMIILDELHEFLTLRKLLPIADMKPIKIEWDINDSIFENGPQMKNENIKINPEISQKISIPKKPIDIPHKIDPKEKMKNDLAFFENSILKGELNNLSDLAINRARGLDILDSKKWIVWTLGLNPEIWKKLLAIYLYNLPILFKKWAYVPEIIYIIFGDNISLKVYIQESMLENINEIGDEELPFVLFHLNDFFVMKSSLECWVDELFERFKVKDIKIICF